MKKKEDSERERAMSKSTVSSSERTIRRIHPVGMRVLVQLKKADEVTNSGLYLPENAKKRGEESQLAEVVEVASARDEDLDEEANISGIPLHATILIGVNAGITVPWDDSLRLIETKEVLAIVEEVELI
ncbi:co-chaperone GroES family protein [bacterium]|nr:co-chaperone GroES family protein [bacterium]